MDKMADMKEQIGAKMPNGGKMTYKVGQRVWWKSQKGVEFYAQVRALHPHADCSDCYALDAVFADNCSDMPDNWANARDMRPVDAPKEDCEGCGGNHPYKYCGAPDLAEPLPSEVA
jgi:hypothetical protein